jgi:hypothetical protein
VRTGFLKIDIDIDFFPLSLDAGEGWGEGVTSPIGFPLPFTLLDKALHQTLVVNNTSYLTG